MTVKYHPAAVKELKGLADGAGPGLQGTMDDIETGIVLPARRERLSADLWEAKYPRGGNTYRLIYAVVESPAKGAKTSETQFLGLLAFQKKTRKTPKQHLKTAGKRLSDWRTQ